jgi:hypothetical protein
VVRTLLNVTCKFCEIEGALPNAFSSCGVTELIWLRECARVCSVSDVDLERSTWSSATLDVERLVFEVQRDVNDVTEKLSIV